MFVRRILEISFCLCYLISLTNALAHSGISHRESKSLLFRIPAKNCSSISINGIYSEGYCDGVASCILNGGFVEGLCGFGICCVVKKSCGETIRTRIGYFRNRKYPDSNRAEGDCSITISRYYSDVTQVRLDFEEFNLEDPDPLTGVCSEEAFSVSGNDPRYIVPTICGENSQKHMYINFANTATATLTLNINLKGDVGSKFNIKVTQYRCNNPNKAPDGCLQYYPNQATGTIENYAPITGPIINNFYDVCIDKNAVGPCIEWTIKNLLFEDLAMTPDECVNTGFYINIPDSRNSFGEQQIVYCYNESPTVTTQSNKFQVVFGGNIQPDITSGYMASFQSSTNC